MEQDFKPLTLQIKIGNTLSESREWEICDM